MAPPIVDPTHEDSSMTQPRPGVSATSAGSPTDPADPWSVDGSVPHQLSTSSAAPPHATYDPLDWPDSTEASNNIHTHHPDLANDSASHDLFGPPSSIVSDPPSAAPVFLARNTRSRHPPAWIQEYFVNTMVLPYEPTCYDEAANDALWCSAMHEEMDAISRNGTWTLAPLSPGKSAISTK
jgi:hypothetical protein